jgi:hypothetical protein
MPNPAIQTAKNAKYAKGKGVERKRALLLGESAIFSNHFCFRVVRVFRGSNCFRRQEAKRSFTGTEPPGVRFSERSLSA